ncbi:MAG: anti-sigma factor [Sphingomicrobium sp.]
MSAMTPERAQLAAEYALGVLDGKDLAEANRAWAEDNDFRRLVEDWAWKLAPLLDEVEERPAPAVLWARIDRLIGERDRVRVLESQVRRSRLGNVGLFATAAALAGVLLLRPTTVLPPIAAPTTQPTPASAAAAPMIAMLGDDKGTKIVANWDPDNRRLVLAVAGDMPADPGHSHELWVIPEGAKPVSLGTMSNDPKARMDLANTLAELLRRGATIAVTLEPPGGSPSGDPTGPILASGKLESV